MINIIAQIELTDYGCGVAQKLGLDMDKFVPWATLSLKELAQRTSEEGYPG